ncbi:gypsy-like retrotransposase [Cucumis melo var. makuwa]|uniref:Gypsy-like retrotransposase n=1 Tax=Cucumis melo var. makuwa TaxID=1194695 RepID=A0A5D3DYD8_CUCMM|nr:gypsy-like retrotransposase [Cucumis melo var. makuwa]TYK28726.1 gypsy-like retrotransposase [Cucumis melo var. makuwa]
MRKGETFVWDETSQNALDNIKKYLLGPLLLGAPVPDKPLILYIVAQEKSIGALLAQEEEKEKERALYICFHASSASNFPLLASPT